MIKYGFWDDEDSYKEFASYRENVEGRTKTKDI